MKKSDNSNGDRSLKRKNIIRGYKIFSEILNDSKIIQTGLVKAYIHSKEKEPLNKKIFSPLDTQNVKVGFIIAKKSVSKSFFRNRLKRLLRESCRLYKIDTEVKGKIIYVVYTLTQNGYNYFKEFPLTKMSFLGNEMKILNSKIELYITEKYS
ncbi:MAG TPA: ribonuclease P protein component [Ignavibacteria bacterium]|nr:ribonuclease P protein component [Ignavibacteria bacterium]